MLAHEFRRLLRDPAAIVSIAAAPLLITVIVGVSLGAPRRLEATIAIDAEPGRDLPPVVTAAFGPDSKIRPVDPGTGREHVERGDAVAAVIVPSDPQAPIRVVGGRDADLATSAARGIAEFIATFSGSRRFDGGVLVTAAGIPERPLRGFDLYGPVVAVFFVLFSVGFVSRGLHLERQDGTLARTLTAPISVRSFIGAKLVAMFIVGLVEVGLVIAGSTLLLGARWGDPALVALVTVAVVAWAVATAAAIAAIARSMLEAHGLELAVSMTAVALGGHMVPLRDLPDIARTVAHLTPNGAAIDAFTNLAAGDHGPSALAGPVAVIAVFGAVAAAVARLGLARRLRS